jgi:hypothetical protein
MTLQLLDPLGLLLRLGHPFRPRLEGVAVVMITAEPVRLGVLTLAAPLDVTRRREPRRVRELRGIRQTRPLHLRDGRDHLVLAPLLRRVLPAEAPQGPVHRAQLGLPELA